MTGIYGLLGINDNDRVLIRNLDADVVFNAAVEFLNTHTMDMNAAYSTFIDGMTELYTERFRLPGGGTLQRRGGAAQSGAVKASGSWDVGYPLEEWGDQIAGDEVPLAYQTVAELDLHLQNIIIRNANTVRIEMMRALFNNTARTFGDPIHGNVTIHPLANNDAVLYPPVLGSMTEATDNHYLASGYVGTAISDVNNPFITIRQELEEHFGAPTGYGNIITFVHPDQVRYIEALTDFVTVPDNLVAVGNDTDVPVNLPTLLGRVIGRISGVWVVEWRWMPTGYIVGVHPDVRRPLKMRVDPADTGLPRGIALATEFSGKVIFPSTQWHYTHRFGLGVSNRLNGVVMQLTASTYSVPTF